MKKNRMLSLLLALTLLLSLAGCGSTSKNTAAVYRSEASAVDEAPAEAELGSGNGSISTQPGSQENRKWIITVNMSAETEDLDSLLEALSARIGEMGGYVEDQSIYNGSTYSSRRYRNADLTIRIPAGDVDGFTQAVGGIANVVSSSKTLEDVTLQYSDTETHVKALETEQARLLELMEQAETMADLLEIESRLTEVRYELESYSSRLKLYDNRIDYATIYLDIQEVQEYTPVEEPTVWQRIRTGFVGSLKGLGSGLVDLGVWLIVYSPYILVLGALATGALFLLRRCRRKKKAQKQEKTDP